MVTSESRCCQEDTIAHCFHSHISFEDNKTSLVLSVSTGFLSFFLFYLISLLSCILSCIICDFPLQTCFYLTQKYLNSE